MILSNDLYIVAAFTVYMVASVIAVPGPAVRDETPLKISCNIQNFQKANYGYSNENINSLANNGGSTTLPSLGASGTKCTRLECQYSSGIYACNDNDGPVTVDNGVLAGYARDILNDAGCSSYPGSDNHQVQGQAFDVGGWNIIVGMADGDSC